VNKQRPVNLDLTKIKFPAPAIASILHRVSGVFIFLLIPLAIWLFEVSLTASGFEDLKLDFHHPVILFLVWALLACLIYHLIAGIRHLLMDMGWFETKASGGMSASLVMGLSIILIILAGIWIW